MARLPRFVIVGHPQHVIIRGINREAIFYADEEYRVNELREWYELKEQCWLRSKDY